jgi:hypothetical protein
MLLMHRWQAHLLAETARANQAEAHVFQMQKAAQRRAASPTPTANTTKVLIRIIAPISTYAAPDRARPHGPAELQRWHVSTDRRRNKSAHSYLQPALSAELADPQQLPSSHEAAAVADAELRRLMSPSLPTPTAGSPYAQLDKQANKQASKHMGKQTNKHYGAVGAAAAPMARWAVARHRNAHTASS